jgi:outer membrane scaffolding protein for murein synthesis (MipA/OmpV family)
MTDRTVFSRLASLAAVFSFLCLVSSIGQAAPKQPQWPEDHLTIGAGYQGDSNPYIGGSPRTTPVPMIDARWGSLFIEGWRVGFEFVRMGQVSLALAAMWDVTELDLLEINDANQALFDGIGDKKPTGQVGLIGHYYSPVGLVEASYFHDVTNKHDSSWMNLKIANPIPETGAWFINPGFFVKVYNEKYNRYYYGVSADDNVRGAKIFYNTPFEVLPERLAEYESNFRPRYKPGNSGHIGVDLEVDYSLTPGLKIQSYWSLEILTGEVETSPLVEDKEIYLIEVGLTYTF